jgi:hypothetical protein
MTEIEFSRGGGDGEEVFCDAREGEIVPGEVGRGHWDTGDWESWLGEGGLIVIWGGVGEQGVAVAIEYPKPVCSWAICALASEV